MATFTAFVGVPTMNGTVTDENGVQRVELHAPCVMLNSTGGVVIPYGLGPEMAAVAPLVSSALTPSSSMLSIRASLQSQIRDTYPTMASTDILKVVWLDSDGLLSL